MTVADARDVQVDVDESASTSRPSGATHGLPGQPSRPSSLAAILAHVSALAVVLGVIAMLIGPGVFTVDEQAYRAQADVIRSDSGLGPAGWGIAYPPSPLPMEGIGVPLANSGMSEEAWYPYPTHPLYVELIAASQGLVGDAGPVGLSLLGLIIVAGALEYITRRLFDVLAFITFWSVGLASPIAFHGFVLWAHVPALAALSVALAFGLCPPKKFPLVANGIVVATSVAVAIFLRSEAPIVAIALAVTFAGAVLVNELPRMQGFCVAGSALVGTVPAVIVDARWAFSITGGMLPDPRATTALDLVGNANAILLYPGREPMSTLRLIAVGFLVLGALWLARDKKLGAVLAVLGAVAGIVGSFAASSYGGFIVAAPAVLVGLALFVGGGRRADGSRLALVMLAGAALCVLGAVVASPSGGGGTGWGGRYALGALLFAVPVALASLVSSWRSIDGARPLIIALGVVTAATQVSGYLTLTRTHELSIVVGDQLDEVLPTLADRVDVIFTADPRTGRLAPTTASALPLVTVEDDAAIRNVLDGETRVDRVAVAAIVQPVEFEPGPGWTVVETGNDRSLQFAILERTR